MAEIMMKPQSGPSPLQQLNTHYDKTTEARAMLDTARQGLDGLVAMGDAVTLGDVVKMAGRLVAKGLDPGATASLLSEAPEKPEFLVEWIAMHDKQLAQREADLDKVQLVLRHQMGVEGLRALTMPSEQATAQSAGSQPEVAPPGPQAPGPQAQPSMMLPSPTGGPSNA